MNHPFPRRWLRLATRELDAAIRRENLPFSLAESLREAVLAEKSALKSARIKRRVRLHRWRDLLRQAKYEAHKVELRLKDTLDPLRVEALTFYLEILRELTRRFEAGRNTAADAHSALPKSQDYRDFIPDKIKAQVHLRFDAIPRGGGKRVADPFGEPRKKTRGQPVPELNINLEGDSNDA